MLASVAAVSTCHHPDGAQLLIAASEMQGIVLLPVLPEIWLLQQKRTHKSNN